MTPTSTATEAVGIAARTARACADLEAIGVGEEFDPRVPAVIREAGLHLALVPVERGGLGGGLLDALEIQAAIAAVDGSAGLGFAMHQHVVGSLPESSAWSDALTSWVYERIVGDGALLNAASTEERGGSPARGALPETTAQRTSDGYVLDGETTWTTWLPALRLALVTARAAWVDEPTVALFVVDLESPGIDRQPGFEALGMRGSASGRLVLRSVRVPGDRLVITRGARDPDPRGPAPQAWFGLVVAATYLGIGEGARRNVARFALDRRPGDGSTSVAEIPSVRLRLGRIDADLRAARIVLWEVARRWTAAIGDSERRVLASDIALAKLATTRAAVTATDEALRITGGPGFLAGRLERAFRDARAGLINPPLEDVALQDFAARLLESERGAGDGPLQPGGATRR